MAPSAEGEYDYEDTQSWRLALFFFCFGLVSTGTEHALHKMLHYLSENRQPGLIDVVTKLKDELMLLGFISLALVLLQDGILAVCVPKCGTLWGSCPDDETSATGETRRNLAAAAPIECDEGQEPFISLTALHQIHIFIFVLAVSLVVTGSAAMLAALGRLRTWAKWEQEHTEFDALLDNNAGNGDGNHAKWEALERTHSRCLYQSLWIPLFGADKVTFLCMRRYFIRKRNRSKTFNFTKYVTECTQDEFAKTLEIDAQDWLLAMLSVALRDYFFSLWASLLSLALSIVTGVKLSAIARMVGKETRDMATGNLDRGSARSVSGSAGDSADEAQEERLLAAAKQAFDQADSDSGGTLDRNEVRDLLTELGGEGMTRGDDNYFLEVFKRFDIDDSGALEYDEFLQCYRFIQQQAREYGLNDDDHSQTSTQSQRPFFHRALTVKPLSKQRPNLKRGRVTWCCGSCGPNLHPHRLRPLMGFIIFQNAMVLAQVVFNIWQVGSSSEYFAKPEMVPGGMLLLQGSLFTLQMLHTSFVLLPMFALVQQMGRHYNVRLFGDVAGKAITEWAVRAKKKTEGNGPTKSIMGALSKTRNTVIGLSPARLTQRNKDQYAVEEEKDQDTEHPPTPVTWDDTEPRSSLEAEVVHLTNSGGGEDNGLSASELLRQGKLDCLPPVPAPVTETRENVGKPRASGTTAADNKQSELPPVRPPPSPKGSAPVHPLGVQRLDPQ